MNRPRGVEKTAKNERGFSLVEILVAIGLIAVLSTVVVTAVLNANKVGQNSAQSAMTQQELLDASNRVTHEVAAATKFLEATSSKMKVLLVEEGEEWEITYFAYQPSAPSTGLGIDASLLPSTPAVMELRHRVDGEVGDIVSTIISGYQPNASIPVFSYFDKTNTSPMAVPVTGDALGEIKRVSFRFTSFAEGRDAPMEIVTSITPRTVVGLSEDAGNVFGVADYIDPASLLPESLNLSGNLPSRSTSASLTWDSIEYAANYTLSRIDRTTGLVSVVYTGPATSYVNTGLERGKTYGYYVTATNTGNASIVSNVVNLTATPAAPVITAYADGLYNTVRWQPIVGATQYRVYDANSATLLATVNGAEVFAHQPTHVNVALRPAYGQSRTYYVVAYNSQGDSSENSNEATAVSPPVAPVLAGSHSNGNRSYNWASVATATKYEVVRILPSAQTYEYGQSVTSGTDTQGIAAVAFTYQVRAGNAAGWGPWSNVLTLNPNPAAPVLTGSHSDGSRSLSWNASANALSYQLERTSPNAKAWATQTTRTLTDSETPSEAVIWSYRVRAYNATGWSPWSNTVNIAPLPAAPSLTGSHSNGDRIVTYADVANATKFELKRIAPVAKVWPGGDTYRGGTDSDVVDGATFTYQARAGNIAGWGPWSNTVTLNPRPGAPSLSGSDYTSGWAGTNGVVWGSVANATRYEWSRGWSDGAWNSTTSTTVRDTAPAADSAYNYYVRACNKTGCSANPYITLKQAPGSFSISSMEQTRQAKFDETRGKSFAAYSQDNLTSSAKIQWGDSPGADSYQVNSNASQTTEAFTFDPVSGKTYSLSVKAVGNTSGITLTQTYKFFSAPSTVSKFVIDPQTNSTGLNTQFTYSSSNAAWKALVSDSTADGGHNIQRKSWTARQANGTTWDYGSDGDFANWNGAESDTNNYSKSDINTSTKTALGAVAATRTHKAIPSGHNSGTIRAQSNPNWIPDSGVFAMSGDYSAVLWFHHSTSEKKMWAGSRPSSGWGTIAFTTGNYPDGRTSGTGYVVAAS